MTRDDEDRLLDEGLDRVRVGERLRAQKELRTEFWRRYWPRMVAAVALVSAAVSVGAVLLFNSVSNRLDATDAAVVALRQQATDAKTQGDKANQALSQRGQATVPIPTPGSADDTEIITAAATARVLASLPDQRPTNTVLGQAVARYVAANPIMASPQEIAASLSGYFLVNPPPKGDTGATGATGQPGTSGANGTDGNNGADGQTPACLSEPDRCRGAKGDKGDAPTQDQIITAYQQAVKNDPNLLCPNGGTFSLVRLQLADATPDRATADTWTCVVQTNPATPGPLTIPTLGG